MGSWRFSERLDTQQSLRAIILDWSLTRCYNCTWVYHIQQLDIHLLNSFLGKGSAQDYHNCLHPPKKKTLSKLAKGRRPRRIHKLLKNSKSYVKPYSIKISDHVLFKHRLSKSRTQYNPGPFEVIDVTGNHIISERDGKIITKDAEKWKNF